MSITSVQTDYLTTLNSSDTITISGNSYINNTIDLSTITLTNGTGLSYGNYGAGSCYTIGTGINCCTTINTISGIDMSGIWSSSGEEWIHKFPEWTRIEDMCKQYPGLAIAFEKFKTTYKLVADDYDTPKDKRPKP